MIQSQLIASATPLAASSVARNLARIGFTAILMAGLVACKSTVKLDEGAPVESRDAASMAAADAANAAARAGAAGRAGLDGRGMDGRAPAGRVALEARVAPEVRRVHQQAAAIRWPIPIARWPSAAFTLITTATQFEMSTAQPSTRTPVF